ncbi:inactive angiotensin-converting enzyme-related protein-like [Argiope bruennichi]|nr:inactive angiotensin-converting enzyme-related protein-like [Argiope bruennichi]
MKPLLATVVALLLMVHFKMHAAAPQPLSLLNTTDADELIEMPSTTDINKDNEDKSKSTTLEDSIDHISTEASSGNISEKRSDEDFKEEVPSTSDGSNIAESNSGSDESSEKIADETTIFEVNTNETKFTTDDNGDDVKSTPVVSAAEAKDVGNDPKYATENIEDIVNKDEIPEVIAVSRYVPPLDPMKHMLMMAEVKKQLEFSSSTVEVPSTNSPTTTVEILTSDKSVPEEVGKLAAESSEVEKLAVSTTGPTTSSPNIPTILINHADEISSETENISTSESSQSSEENKVTEASSTTAVTDNTPIDVSSSNTHDINHESSVLLHSSELFSGKNESSENSTNSNESFYSESTEQSQTSSPIESTTILLSSVTFATDSPHSSTDIKSEESIEEASLVRSDDETDSVEISEAEENTTQQPKPTEKIDVLEEKESNVSFSEAPSTPVFYSESDLLTTVKPVVETEIINEKLLASEDEVERNVTLEESEIKEESLPFSTSDAIERENVTYSSVEIAESRNSDSSTPSAPVDQETTTQNILTTIRDIVFGFSTSAPEKDTDSPKSESPDLISTSSENDIPSESVMDSESIDNAEIRSESELPADSLTSEIIKVEAEVTSIDSISTENPISVPSAISDGETKADLKEDLPTTISTEEVLKYSPDKEPEFVNNTDDRDTILFENLTETTAAPEILSTVETPLKSELLESSDPVNVPEISSEEPANNDSLPEEKQTVKLDTKSRYVSGNNSDMVAAVQFLHYHDKASSEQCFKLVDAHWKYATNLTDENKKKQLEQTLEYSLFHKEAWKNATSFAWKSFNDTLLRRWFKSLSVLGTAALPEDKLNEFNRLKAEMKNTYSTAKVCPYISPEASANSVQNPKDCKLSLEPDIQRILTKSRDYDELAHVWKAWRDAAGKPIREKYLRFVNLSNEAARLNGFPDTGDMWREAYESDTFEEDLEALWEQLRPLYEHLHAYVRRRLIQVYGNDKIKDDGPIPAHLFGNMWAQSWVSLLDITQPFLGKPSVDVTPIMEAKNLSALEMFKISEEFFTSLGLKPMPEEFWRHSLIEKPKDREIICHASAWDFCNGKDYRIKQCTDITMEDLITVHHEMGHIQYFLQYARQPNVFREGANPGFHEAIGDVLALSVSTPKHLKSIGLLDEVADDPEGDLNFLLRTALDKVSFLPSGYLIDLWRWGLFRGEIKPENMNSKWWELRLKYQGICPPVKRYDTDFDPGAKYHVPGNVPYIRYFVSFVIQFQFHKVLCDAAGHTGPLYKCDIYRSREAGQILSQVMELGSSEHWSEAMKIMTGGATNKMDAGPILEYFQPLLEFLEEQNRNETLGWRSDDSTICP